MAKQRSVRGKELEYPERTGGFAPAAGSGQILKSATAFFRRGTSGAGRELLTDGELAHYHARAASLGPADMLAWLHRPDIASAQKALDRLGALAVGRTPLPARVRRSAR